MRTVLGLVILMAAAVSYGQQGATPLTPDSPDFILVRVNGLDITRRDLDRHVDMMVELLKNKRASTPPKVIEAFKRREIKKLSDEIYRRAVVSTSLASSNITTLAEARATVEKQSLRNFGKRGQTIEQLKEQMERAGFGKEFEANLAADAQLLSFEMTVCSNEYYVTKADLDETRAKVDAYNAIANATNDLTMAKAKDILARAKRGDDFAKLADEYSELDDKQPGGDMGDCDENDFPENPQLWKQISRLPVGGLTDVVETEDGYAIYKVIRKNSSEESDTGLPSVTISQIYFRRAFVFPEQSDEELFVDVEREKRDKLLNDIYRRFRAQSEVSYPHGRVPAKPILKGKNK